MTLGRWRPITGPHLPGIEYIDREMRAADLPGLEGDLVYVVTDIGGEHKGSDFLVVTALFVAMYGSAEWERRRRRVRQRFLGDGRRMSFKGLGDRQRDRALGPFLEAAGRIDGIVVSLAFSKRLRHVWAPPKALKLWKESVGMEARWNPKKFERLVRVANLVSLMIGGLGRDGQNIYWISDEDAVFANDAHGRDAARLMAGMANLYIRHEPGELGVGTTTIDPGDRAEEDLAAVADLVAGTLAEVCTEQARDSNRGRQHLTGLQRKSHEVGHWMSSEHPKLGLMTFVFVQGWSAPEKSPPLLVKNSPPG